MKPGACILTACLSISAQVPFDRIRSAGREPGNWLTYSGNYSAHRYSLLDQINAGNVAKLKPVWSVSCTSPSLRATSRRSTA